MTLEQIDLSVPSGDNNKQANTKINSNFEELGKWLQWGAGIPEGIISGYIGALYLDYTNGVMYQKATGNNTKTGWQSIAGTTLTSAQHYASAKDIAVSGSTLTLTEDSNIFVVSGTSTISSITGWTQGIAFIRWTEDRTITHNATSLILQNTQDRTIKAGDISIFEMSLTGAREINYLPVYLPILAFKEYGLELSHKATDLITVNAGQRYADDRTTQLVLSSNTDYDASSLADNTYYLFGGYNSSSVAVLEADTNADGSGLSTITSGKTSLGRFVVSSSSVDTEQLWTKHADGTETYVYQQASGNFPSSSVTISHNLGTRDITLQSLAVDNSNDVEYQLAGWDGANPMVNASRFDSANTLVLHNMGAHFCISTTTNITQISGSSLYYLKVVVKTRFA